MGLRITSVEDKINEDGLREVHVNFNDGKVVKICASESTWAIWNAPAHYRWMSIDIADKCNARLHGNGEFPQF